MQDTTTLADAGPPPDGRCARAPHRSPIAMAKRRLDSDGDADDEDEDGNADHPSSGCLKRSARDRSIGIHVPVTSG